MDYLRNLKNKIIETAPSYEKINPNSTLTSKMLNARTRLGFTRLFYPGAHIEGEVKIWDRRYKTGMFKNFRYFGVRGEVFYLFVFFYFLKKLSVRNFERNKISELFSDRDVYFKVKNIDLKY